MRVPRGGRLGGWRWGPFGGGRAWPLVRVCAAGGSGAASLCVQRCACLGLPISTLPSILPSHAPQFYIGIGRSRTEQMMYIHAGAHCLHTALLPPPPPPGWPRTLGLNSHAARARGPSAACRFNPPNTPTHLQHPPTTPTAGSAVTSDVRYLRADDPRGEWRLVLPRTHETEYSVEDRGDHFFITIRCGQAPVGWPAVQQGSRSACPPASPTSRHPISATRLPQPASNRTGAGTRRAPTASCWWPPSQTRPPPRVRGAGASAGAALTLRATVPCPASHLHTHAVFLTAFLAPAPPAVLLPHREDVKLEHVEVGAAPDQQLCCAEQP